MFDLPVIFPYEILGNTEKHFISFIAKHCRWLTGSKMGESQPRPPGKGQEEVQRKEEQKLCEY